MFVSVISEKNDHFTTGSNVNGVETIFSRNSWTRDRSRSMEDGIKSITLWVYNHNMSISRARSTSHNFLKKKKIQINVINHKPIDIYVQPEFDIGGKNHYKNMQYAMLRTHS